MEWIQMNRRKVILYCMIFFEICYLFFLLVSHSKYLDSYFIRDKFDTGMDFFNMLAVVGEGNPYNSYVNYPAFTFLILKIIWHIVPSDAVNIEEGINGKYLRGYMPIQMSYTIGIIVIVFIIYGIIKYITKKTNEGILCFWVIMLSGPMLFTLERGNFILLAFVLTLVYILWYDNSELKFRVVAYIALAIAAAIKIYPALFGVLTLSRKRYKETSILVFLGVTAFISPFFKFGGLRSIKRMIEGIQLSSEAQGNMGMAYNFSLSNIIKIIESVLNIEITHQETVMIKIVMIGLCIFLYFTTNEMWKKTLAIVLNMIWIPTFSYTYMLVFFVIPFLLLCYKGELLRKDFIYLILLGLIMLPYALPALPQYDIVDAKNPLTVPTVLVNLFIIVLFFSAIIDNIFIKVVKNK